MEDPKFRAWLAKQPLTDPTPIQLEELKRRYQLSLGLSKLHPRPPAPPLPPSPGIESAGQAAWQIAQVPIGFGEQALTTLGRLAAEATQGLRLHHRVPSPPLPPAGIAREIGRALGGGFVAPEFSEMGQGSAGEAAMMFPPFAAGREIGPVLPAIQKAVGAVRGGRAAAGARVAESLAVPGRAEAGFVKLPKKAVPPVTPGVRGKPLTPTEAEAAFKAGRLIKASGDEVSRAMREGLPPELYEEYLRLWVIEKPSLPQIQAIFEREMEVLGKQPGWIYNAKENVWYKLKTIPKAEIIKPSVPPVPPGVAKEPWQMTREEFILQAKVTKTPKFADVRGEQTRIWKIKEPGRRTELAPFVNETAARESVAGNHKITVSVALREGKPVPPEVLAEYPDLAKAIPKAEAAVPVTKGEMLRSLELELNEAMLAGRPVLWEQLQKVINELKAAEVTISADDWIYIRGLGQDLKELIASGDILAAKDVERMIFKAWDEAKRRITPIPQVATKAKAVAPPAPPPTGIPTMITRDMEARLRAMGVTETELGRMTPQQAWERLGGMPEAGLEGPPPGVKVTEPAVSPTAEELTIFPKAAEITPPPPGGPPPPEVPPIAPLGTMGPQLPGEPWMPAVRSNEEILALTYRADWMRQFTDWVNQRSRLLGRALQIVGLPERGGIKEGIVLRESIMADWESGMVGAMARLRSLGTSRQLFAVDKEGRALIGGKRVALGDVLEHPTLYKDMTPGQAQFAQTLHRLSDTKLAALEAEGIEVRLLSFEEGGHYVGRRVVGRIGAEDKMEMAYIGGPRRPGAKAPFERVRGFDTEEEALSLGYRYLSPEEAMQANLTAAGRRIADKRASDYILSRVPYRTGAAPQELIVARDFAAQKLGRASTYRAVVERSLRGEKPPEATLRSVAASFPNEVTQLRAALGGKVALRDLRARAKTIISESWQEFNVTRSVLSKAKEQARVARLGEAGVQAPAFAGKFFSIKEAEAINQGLGLAPLPLWGSVARAIAWLNAPFRLMITTFDVGVSFIQLLTTLAKNPVVWGKATVRGLESLASGQRYQRFLATHAKTISEWSPHGAIFTPSEFTEALRPGGALAKIPVLRAIARPFGRYFESILNAAEIYGLEATGHLAKTAGQKADLAAHWNVMTGRFDSARLGISASQRYTETALLFAPRFRRAAYTLMTDIARGGIRGDQAREALAKLTLAGLLGYIGLAKALGQEPILDPRERGRWMTVEIAGQRVGLGSAYVMSMRLLAEIGVELATGNPENIPGRVTAYMKGLAAPVPGGLLDIAYRPYYGGSGIDRTLQLTKRVVGENLVPIWGQAFLERKPYHSWETTATGMVAEAIALRSFPATASQMRFQWRDALEKYKAIPTDPLELKTGELSRTQFRKDNPEIDAKLFITGEVTSFQTGGMLPYVGTGAVQHAFRLIQENRINPDDVRGIRERKDYRERARKAGKRLVRNEVDILIALLEKAKPLVPTPVPIPTPVPLLFEWYRDTDGVMRPRLIPTPTPIPAGIR